MKNQLLRTIYLVSLLLFISSSSLHADDEIPCSDAFGSAWKALSTFMGLIPRVDIANDVISITDFFIHAGCTKGG